MECVTENYKKMKRKILFLGIVAVACLSTVVNIDLNSQKVSRLTFQNMEAFAKGGEGGSGYFDDFEAIEDPKTKCAILINGKEVDGIWMECKGGNEECVSGCAVK